MLQLMLRLVQTLGSGIGVAAFLLTPNVGLVTASRIALWSLVVLTASVAVADVSTWIAKRPRRYAPGDDAITRYLGKWLGSGGRAAIFSRDMSWAGDNEVGAILRTKARQQELIVCVARPSTITEQLRNVGADIHAYDALGYEPKARFTIIDHNKADARVAIGFVEAGRHTIREYTSDDRAVLALATDLVEIVRRIPPKR